MADAGADAATAVERARQPLPADWLCRLREALLPRADHDPASWLLAGSMLPAGAWAREIAASELRPAAVLIPILLRASGPTVLFTVRSEQLRHHAGQIAFPGGRLEQQGEDPLRAALREAEEEIGLGAAAVDALGFLSDQVVLTGFRITPIVGLVREPPALVCDAAEVASVFEVPWHIICDESRYRSTQRELRGRRLVVQELEFEGHRIWGATAGMLVALRRAWSASL